ncbi:MAG: endonuclease domain-containing protein [Candidatus Latescibacteria bacterium]|jgi:very-short-patch-repair endonuclease|nr:endonuclease domain-containing protein [Candidatus Latescibacterota bacterium]MBT4139358.1 endonuclease domain-containing protein [Candidatus Latescibacterota bacterium]MBT5829327.1 endonuclease domain-containing protein [Candidatus Latescibacterota bacterium]
MADGKRHLRASGGVRQRARELRKNLTPSEKVLWQSLRGRKCNGWKFRRQHPIGRFIVDFYCAEIRLIVEVDGGVHLERELYDAERTELLEKQGYRVIRFSNEEVFQNLDRVLMRIASSIEDIAQ